MPDDVSAFAPKAKTDDLLVETELEMETDLTDTDDIADLAAPAPSVRGEKAAVSPPTQSQSSPGEGEPPSRRGAISDEELRRVREEFNVSELVLQSLLTTFQDADRDGDKHLRRDELRAALDVGPREFLTIVAEVDVGPLAGASLALDGRFAFALLRLAEGEVDGGLELDGGGLVVRARRRRGGAAGPRAGRYQ